MLKIVLTVQNYDGIVVTLEVICHSINYWRWLRASQQQFLGWLGGQALLGLIPVRGGGHSLIWPILVCAAEKGMVFKVLSLKQGIQFHYLAS